MEGKEMYTVYQTIGFNPVDSKTRAYGMVEYPAGENALPVYSANFGGITNPRWRRVSHETYHLMLRYLKPETI